MKGKVYEIASIERYSGALEADSLRIGRRYIPMLIQHGAAAVLIHADDLEKSLVTSRVEDVVHLDGGNTVVFETRHTKYTLKKVEDA